MSRELKIVTLGPSGIGKTCLIHALVDEKFETYEPTVGCESFETEKEIEGNHVKFVYFDTAGQERYATINRNYIRGKDIFLVLAEPSDQGIQDIEKQITLIDNNVGKDSYFLIIVFSKYDLYLDEDIEARKKQCEKYQAHAVIETSAKSLHKISELEFIIGLCTPNQTSTARMTPAKKSCC